MKVLSLRLRGMKGELEELGEESEGVENISKMQGQILNMTGGKVNIFDDAGDFKSTYDIMKEIAEVYDDLSLTDQASLLETIAGKDRANDVASLLSNFETAIKMVDTAENSFGSARGENEKYLDSLQGRIDVMTSSLQVLSNSALESDFLKGAVSGVTAFIDILSSLIDTFGILPIVAAAAGAGLSVFGKGIVTVDKSADGLINKIKIFGTSLSEIKDMMYSFSSGSGGLFSRLDNVIQDQKSNPFDDFKKQIENDASVFDSIKGLSGDALTSALEGQSSTLKNYMNTVEAANRTWDDYVQSAREATIAVQAQGKGLKSAGQIIREYNSGCQNIGMSQADFAASVAQTNPTLGRYLKGLNGASASAGGYVKSLVAMKVASFAAEAATLALNTALTMGIGIAIQMAIEGIMSLITYYDDLAESVEESSTAFEQSNSQIMSNKSSFDSAVQSYDKLSKGVNKLGENVSLSADEYDEYVNAVNTIAESAPNMVAGYDAQGNAILNTAANVETLTDAYNDLIAAESRAFLQGDEDKGYVGLDKIAEDYAHDLASVNDYDLKSYQQLEELLTSNNLSQAINSLSEGDKASISQRLESMGLDRDGEGYAEFISKSLRESSDIVRSAVKDYMADYDSLATEMNQAAQSMLTEALYSNENLLDMDDSVRNLMSQFVSTFDNEFYNQLIENSGGDRNKVGDYLKAYMQDFTNSMGELSVEQQKVISDAFDMQTDFETGDVSMEEFANKAKEVNDILKDIGLDDDVRKEMMLTLGFEFEGDDPTKELKNFTEEYDKVQERFSKSKDSDAINDWLKSLSGSELGLLMEVDVDGDESLQELQQILSVAKTLNDVDTISITVETEGLEKLNTAIQESNGAYGLTEESIANVTERYSDLDGFDPAGLFEKTTTGVRLNTEALGALEEQYVAVNKAAAEQSIDNLVKQASEVKKLRDSVAEGTADWDRYDAQLSALQDEIQNAQMAAAAYDGLTSAYNRWINAQSSGQEGDMYDSIYDGIEGMTELANEGKWGNTELQGFINMFSAEGSMDNATPQQYADAWGSAIQKAQRYFTEGTQGLDNFFSDVAARTDELVYMDENGSWQIKPGVEIEDFAREMEMAESTIEAIFGQANEYGANFKIGIDQKSVDELIEESNAAAQAAQESLQQYLGEDFVIDATVTVNEDGTNNAISQLETLEAQRKEIDESDIDVDVKTQGLAAADAAIRAVVAQKIQLEQPAFMQLDVSGVDSGMQDALAKAQELQTAINELNNLQLQKEYGIDIDQSQIDNAQAKVDELAQAVADNGDLKVKLGIDESAGIDEVKSAFSPENIGTIDVKFQGDTTQAEADINNLKNNQSIDVQVNLAGDDKIAALESKMNAIDNKTIDATVSLTGDDKIAALESKMNAIDNKTIDASVSLTGAEQIANLESKMNAIDNKTINVNVAVQNAQAITSLQNSINSIQNKVADVSVSTTGTESVQALTNAINMVTPKSVDVTANVSGTNEVNALTKAIKALTGKVVSVTAKVSGTSAVNALRNAISGVQSKTVNVTTYRTTVNRVTEAAVADGTATPKGAAFAYGTEGKAFKRGDWGIKSDGVALGGELGPELLVRDGKYRLIGENSAEFFQHKRGDIVFNAEQTREIFEKGRITGLNTRGQAFANGTFPTQGNAYASVTGGWKPGGVKPSGSSGTTVVNNTTNNYNYNTSNKSSSSSSKSSSSSAKKAADEFKESLDWIEIAIDRVERAIDSLDKTATNTFLDFAERDGALLQQMQQVTNEINLQQQAYERYMAEANSVGLSADWQDKVKNGRIDIEVITDEGLKEQIDQFQEWYEKALDARDALDDLNITISELNKQRWDTLIEEFELYLNRIQNSGDMIEEIVNRAEVDGQIISKNYYTELQNNKHAEAEMLREERKRLIALRDEMVNNGSMEVMSDEWYAMNNQIDEITVSIYECQTAWAEYQKSIRETEWKVFDILQDRITGVADEAQFLIDLMSNEKLFEDNGQLTDKGWATMGLYGQQYNILMNQADRYAEEAKRLEEEMNNSDYLTGLTGDGHDNLDIVDRYYELIEAQQEAILSAEQMKDAMKDMVEEGIELELDALDDLIDKYLDALQAQKD